MNKTAIQKAIENGYMFGTYKFEKFDYEHHAIFIDWNSSPQVRVVSFFEIWFDPMFWVFLGKALGWKKYVWCSYKAYSDFDLTSFTDEEEYEIPWKDAPYSTRYIASEYYQIRLVKCLQDKKTAESFFGELLLSTENI